MNGDTPNWKPGYLQVVEKMVDLVGIAPGVFNVNGRVRGLVTPS